MASRSLPLSLYRGGRMVSIFTGIVPESFANADNAYDIGKAVADHLTGQTCGEIKLKRTDKITSIREILSSY